MPTDHHLMSRTIRLASWTLVAVFICQSAIMIARETHLYGDGVHYLYALMARPRPMGWDFSRRFAHLVTQIPVVTGIHAGITDVSALSRLLGIGLYLPHTAGLMACLWIARERISFMIWPLLSAAAVTSNADFFIVSESHQLVAFFWPLVLLFTLRQKWTRGDYLLAYLFAVPTLLSYESMITLGPVLAGLAAWRAWRAGREADVVEQHRFVAFAVYFVAGIAIAFWWSINPRNPANFEGFVSGLSFYRDADGNWHLPAVLSVAGILLVAAMLFFPGLEVRLRRVLLAAFAIACAVVALWPFIRPDSVVLMLHLRARTLNALLPPVLALLLMLMIRRPPDSTRLLRAFAVVGMLAASQIVWHSIAARHWAQYLELFRSEVASSEGLLPYHDTQLSLRMVNGGPVAGVNLTWVMPQMSILLSPAGRVKSIIYNPDQRGWTPFDPARPEQLADLSRYGITYEYLSSPSPSPQ